MLIFNGINKRYLLIVFIFYELLKKNVRCFPEFINIKKISKYDIIYFVVLNTGLYLYNINTFDCALILSFNNSVYRKNGNNKFNLTELVYEDNSFILCLVNEYLFIFNSHNNKTLSYKINEIVIQKI